MPKGGSLQEERERTQKQNWGTCWRRRDTKRIIADEPHLFSYGIPGKKSAVLEGWQWELEGPRGACACCGEGIMVGSR